MSRLSRSSSLRYESPRPIPRGSLEHHDTPLAPTQHYDIPRNQQSVAHSNLYDSPRPQVVSAVPSKSLIRGVRTGTATPPGVSKSVDVVDCQYDVPRPIQEQQPDVPGSGDRSSGVSYMSVSSTSSSVSSLPASMSPNLSMGSSNRSSLEVQEEYDIPPEPRRIATPHQRPQLPPREGKVEGIQKKGEGVYDVPPQVSRDARTTDTVDSGSQRISSGSDCSGKSDVETGTGLPLELYSASDMLAKLQQNVHCSLEKLVNFDAVSSPTKTLSNERFQEGENIIDRLSETLREFVKFSEGSTVNASKQGNEKLANTLRKHIKPVISTQQIVANTWNSALANKDEAMDMIKQLANITKPLDDNVRHLANLIQTNANLIFVKNNTNVTNQKYHEDDDKTPVQEKPCDPSNESAFLEDYDYVKLESRESVDREHKQMKESLPVNLRKSYDNLVKQSHSLVDNDHQRILQANSNTGAAANTANLKPTSVNRLDANDRQVLQFYGNQADLHIQHLNTAIDAFFLTIEENQPPKVFIAHSKFVILSAHKLVFIGDTVHRNVVNTEVRTRVLNSSNALCDGMKNTVAAAKRAAIQFPSVTAVQAMVDSFAAISHLASNLRNAICQA